MLHNRTAKGLKPCFLLIFVFSNFLSLAQDGHRVFSFKDNATYQSDVTINSRSLIQRGKKMIEINSVSNISKTSAVVAAGDNGYTFNVNVKKLDNVIDVMGKKTHYNSSAGLDGSTIKGALDHMVNKPTELRINKYGIIESFNAEKVELATDTLIAFAGLQPEVFEKGKLFGLVADITYTKNLLKGHNWTDVLTTSDGKITTKFWVENVNETNTVLKFTSSSIGKLINSNSNGTYLVDNKTGLILEKLVYVVSVGYQVSAGGIVYGVSRAANIFEKTKLLP